MKRKNYARVTDFERATSYCPRKAAPRGRPLYLAWRILDDPSSQCFDAIKARDYFRTPIPEAFADKLAHRAEAVFARHPFWQRKAAPRGGRRRTLQAAQFQSQRGRDAILTSMRHWLAGVLAKERPALFHDLPESFKVGHPLPAHSTLQKKAPHPGPLPRAERENHRQRFVHGCELLAA